MLKGAHFCAPFYDCLGGSGVKGVAFARVPLFDCQQICSLFPLLRAFSQKILILQKFKADAPS